MLHVLDNQTQTCEGVRGVSLCGSERCRYLAACPLPTLLRASAQAANRRGSLTAQPIGAEALDHLFEGRPHLFGDQILGREFMMT